MVMVRALRMAEEVVIDSSQAHHTRAPSIPIPTDDPQAALAFCRQLATLVQAAGEYKAAPLPAWAAHEQPEPELSVVIPVYNEADNLPELLRRLTNVLTQVGSPYEIVFVDDGSHDESVATLRDMARTDPRYVEAIQRTLVEVGPVADGVLKPHWMEGGDDEMTLFGVTVAETRAFAMKALERRRKVIGLLAAA